jgi:hypothetical protein
MAPRHRRHGRYSLRPTARHQASLAHANNGPPTCKGGAVALANKIARMAWAIMVHGERYREPKLLLAA